ncbi:MAG: LPS export ABC transporter periplasmic protein LptC [Bdellovibrionales bacterium]|nr:LPS export ABC transporter periplasmic protein LptC [Bdellovibrionales bacterium]
MKKLTQVLLFVLFVAIIVEVVIIAPNVLDQDVSFENNTEVESLEQDTVQEKLTDMYLVESRQDEKEWELWAKEAKSYKDKKIWDLEDVKAKFFGNNGVVFHVTGKKGQVDIKTKDMEIHGDVVTKTSNGYVFQTEKVLYTSQERTLYGPENITMKGPADAANNHLILTGKSLVANLDSSLMEVKQNVAAEKPFKENKTVYIKSHRAQFSGQSNYARFLDDVVIDYETMRLTGPDATFNYDTDKNLVTSMLVQGGAKVSDTDKWATSETVDVQFEKEKYIFRGSPRVVQNNDELKGEEIIFYNGGKKVKVFKARANLDENNSRVTK